VESPGRARCASPNSAIFLRGVSETVRTAQRRELEKDGVVNRRAVRSSPPKATYSLSPSGQTLIPLLEGLCDGGSKQFGITPNLPRKSRWGVDELNLPGVGQTPVVLAIRRRGATRSATTLATAPGKLGCANFLE
jgi:HxlR-like helix-turn-helix